MTPADLARLERTIACVAPKVAAIEAVRLTLGGGGAIVPSYPIPDYVRRMFELMPDPAELATPPDQSPSEQIKQILESP